MAKFEIADTGRSEPMMRWAAGNGRCELWTGERWIDLERDLLKPLQKFHDEMEARR